MRKPDRWIILLILAVVQGLAALFLYFQIPSESESAVLWGFSLSRLLVGGGFLIFVLAIFILILLIQKFPDKYSRIKEALDKHLKRGRTIWKIRFFLFTALLACSEVYLLSFLALPPHMLWLALVITEGIIFSFLFYRVPLNILRGWQSLNDTQKKVFWVLIAISLVLFLSFIPQNLRGIQDRHQLYMTGGDEKITYPYVEWILKLSGPPEEWIYNLIVYEDYHYGYPFYLLSALVVLPVRLLFGQNFGDQTWINVFLMRQFISSLPVFITTLLLVWMNTKFKSFWRSLILYFLIFLIPNAAFYHIRFWHPDGLVVMAVVFTLFFLSRDRYRLGWNFYVAAIACGLATSIKLYGFFFVLSIPLYLLACRLDGKVAWRKLIMAAALFVLSMSLSIIISSPFLGVPSARQRLIQVQTEKSNEIQYGYGNADPENVYSLGLTPWIPYLESGFGPAIYLVFLLVSALIGCVWGKNRLSNQLMLAWFAVNAIYLISFSAVKSQHYWMPAMLPLYGAALNLTDLSSLPGKEWIKLSPNVKKAALWIATLAALIMIVMHVYTTRSIFLGLFQ
ncbi:MAG: hypothetical protein LWX83_16135 [Anaerolineae bacterium]|nr:hypothetical protein [Anaerolineae bacterium]